MPNLEKAEDGGAVRSLLNLLRLGKKKKDRGKEVASKAAAAPVSPTLGAVPAVNRSPDACPASKPDAAVTATGAEQQASEDAPAAHGRGGSQQQQAQRAGPSFIEAFPHDKLLAALESTQNMPDPQPHSADVADLSAALFANLTNTASAMGMVLPPRLAEGAASGLNSGEAQLQRIAEDGSIICGSSYVPYGTTTVAPLHSAPNNVALSDANNLVLTGNANNNLDSCANPLCSTGNNLQDMLFADYDALERIQGSQTQAYRGSVGATAAVAGGRRGDMMRAPHVPTLIRPLQQQTPLPVQQRTTPQLEMAGLQALSARGERINTAASMAAAEPLAGDGAGPPGLIAGLGQGVAAPTGSGGRAPITRSAPLAILQQRRQQLEARNGPWGVMAAQREADEASGLQVPTWRHGPLDAGGGGVPVSSGLGPQPVGTQAAPSGQPPPPAAATPLSAQQQQQRQKVEVAATETLIAAVGAGPSKPPGRPGRPVADLTADYAAVLHNPGCATRQDTRRALVKETGAGSEIGNMIREAARAAAAALEAGPTNHPPAATGAAAIARGNGGDTYDILLSGPPLPSYTQRAAATATNPSDPQQQPQSGRPMKLTTGCLSAYTALYDFGGEQNYQKALQRKMLLVQKWLDVSDLTAPPDPRLEVPVDQAAPDAPEVDGFDGGGSGGGTTSSAAPVSEAATTAKAGGAALAAGGTEVTPPAAGATSSADAVVGGGPAGALPRGQRDAAPGQPGVEAAAPTSHGDHGVTPPILQHHHLHLHSARHLQQQIQQQQQQERQLPHVSGNARAPPPTIGSLRPVAGGDGDGGATAAPATEPEPQPEPAPEPQPGRKGGDAEGGRHQPLKAAAAVTALQGGDPAAAADQQSPLQYSLPDLYDSPQHAMPGANLPPRMLSGSEANPAAAAVAAPYPTVAAAAGASAVADDPSASRVCGGHGAAAAEAAFTVEGASAASCSPAEAVAPMPTAPPLDAASATAAAAESSNGGGGGTGPGRTKTIAVASHCPPELQPQPPSAPWTIDDFSLPKKLYEGSLSVVCQAQHKRSGRHVALKIYKRSRLHEMERFQLAREICLHIRIVHPHVVALFAAWKDSKYVYLALDWAPLGNMFGYLVGRGGRLAEQEAARVVVRPLLCALAFLHAQHFIHRDVKLENLLLDASCCLKLADFGLAIDQKFEQANTRLGTFGYFAPEVLDCPLKKGPFDLKDSSIPGYDSRVDVWSAGVVAYEVLTGRAPFSASSPAKIIQAIRSRVLEFPGLSDEAADFLRSALTRDPAARPTAKQLLSHPWILTHCGVTCDSVPGVGGGPGSEAAIILPASLPPAPSAVAAPAAVTSHSTWSAPPPPHPPPPSPDVTQQRQPAPAGAAASDAVLAATAASDAVLAATAAAATLTADGAAGGCSQVAA